MNANLQIISMLASLMIMGSGPLPMDVWWSEQDDNALPLNPVWEYSREGKGLPDAGILCNHFPNRNGILYVQNCTSQQPVVDEPRPFHGIIPNDRYLACTYLKNVPNDLRFDSVHGHVNWTIATYTGTMSFTDFGFPPFADGDWDWLLETENKAGYLQSNDPGGIIAEFNGAEISNRVRVGWFGGMRETILTSRKQPAVTRAAAHDLPAIVTGILGIDTKHVEHAEVHPIYALALRTDGDDQNDVWDFFVRNWGNEGGCSNDQHNFGTRRISLLFPAHGGTPPELSASEIGSSVAGLRWGAARAIDGLVVTFELPPPNTHAIVYGNVYLCFEFDCPFVDYLPWSATGRFDVQRDDSIAVVRHRWLTDSEPRTLVRDTQH